MSREGNEVFLACLTQRNITVRVAEVRSLR